MSDDFDHQLHELRKISEAIRLRLEGVEYLIVSINERLGQLSTLRPDLALTLVADVFVRGHDAGQTRGHEGPSITACVRVPGGVGIVVWRGSPDAAVGDGRSVGSGSLPIFVPFSEVPPLLQRLVIPHLEHVLENLRDRVQR